MCDVKILLEESTGEIIEKKSRFIAYIKPVNTEEEATAFIESIKKKHWDAKHNCSAFTIGNNNEITRCSDDGEPSGTAGRPMLEVLTGQGIHNIAAVVTRYFGGILLGTGGLVRAYQSALKEAIKDSKIGELVAGAGYKLDMDYNDYNKIQSYLLSENYLINNSIFEEKVTLEVTVPISDEEKFVKNIIELTLGRIKYDRTGDIQYIK